MTSDIDRRGVEIRSVIQFDERRRWDRAQHIVLVGPGGAGKSSLGEQMARLLACSLIDLDTEFGSRIGNISAFIREESYERYKLENAALAGRIMSNAIAPTVLVTSSGFLTPDNPSTALANNRRITINSYSICLLPSRDVEVAVRIIVKRQLQRPFARDRAHEEATIRARYPIYAREGDLLIFSSASPDEIALATARRLAGEA